MITPGRPLTVLLAPNDDGFGTAAWAVALAHALRRAPWVGRVRLLVSAGRWDQFHRDKYPAGVGTAGAGPPWLEPLLLPDDLNPIQVAKAAGAVDVPATTARVQAYPASRRAYAEALGDLDAWDEADLVVDLGLPQLVRAAATEAERRRRHRQPPLTRVTLLDHAWSLTLAQIIAPAGSRATHPSRAARQALAAMRQDEARTGAVLLFDEPLGPALFQAHWLATLGRAPHLIPGVLGGPGRVLAYAGETRGGSRLTRARAIARRLLGLDPDRPALFVTGGGTAVWDEVLTGLLDEYSRQPPAYQVVVHSPAEAARRGVRPAPVPVHLTGGERVIERAAWGPAGAVTFLGRVSGETHHVLVPAFDLVLSRAGGGTVGDAIAQRTPLQLVEEPGMWQVEQIRAACLRLGLAGRDLSLADFQQLGRAAVETAGGALWSPAGAAAALAAIPNQAETWIVDRLADEHRRQTGRGQG